MPDMTHAQYAESLRMIADWFEAHPEVPLPYRAHDFGYQHLSTTQESMARIARAMGACKKEYTDSGLFHLKRDFGAVTVDAFCSRTEVCKRKVVGSKHMPEQVIPAHDQDIVEWECFEEPLLAAAPSASAPAKMLPEVIDIDAPLAQVIRHDQLQERES